MLRLDLQLFGGRGGGSGGGGAYARASSDGALERAKIQTINGTMRNKGGRGFNYHSNEVLEATTDGKGNLTFRYAKPTSYEKTAKTNKTTHVTYELAHGALDGKTFGINWKNVKSISGQTYSIKDEAKAAGLRFDGATKTWRRR